MKNEDYKIRGEPSFLKTTLKGLAGITLVGAAATGVMANASYTLIKNWDAWGRVDGIEFSKEIQKMYEEAPTGNKIIGSFFKLGADAYLYINEDEN